MLCAESPRNRLVFDALFAVAGYRYIFQRGLGIVRKQIKEPDVDHIPTFLTVLPGEHHWSERLIIDIREPESLQSWAVQIGRYVTFLPKSGDIEFYGRLAEERARFGRHQATFTGKAIEWPTEPFFGLKSV